MSARFSRRAWMRTAATGLGAGLVAPSSLAALVADGAPRASDAASAGIAAHARRVAARRAAGPVRLQSNENPYGMSPKARDAMLAGMDDHNKYGSPVYDRLAALLARQVGVPADHVLVTQGSSEVLAAATLAFSLPGGDVMSALPSFERVPQTARAMGRVVHEVPLTEAQEHDLDAMDRRLVQSVGFVFVCNPSNPNGTLVDDARLRDFVASASRRTMVLVDEAYHDYVEAPGYHSLADLVADRHNVIVSRTASKIHGMAGLRIGFAIARPDVLDRLRPFTTGRPNAIAAHGAIAALEDEAYRQWCVAQNREGRAILQQALDRLGRRYVPSHTNFVFMDAGRPVRDVQADLAARGFLVGRPFPGYDTWVRVSIGTPDEMRAFVDVLPDAVRA